GTRIADFGCGPGLYATRLAALGAEVTGIDFSANSLKYARETAVNQNLSIEYIHSNYLEYSSNKRFDLILMIFCDFCALSPDQRQLLLGIFAKHLTEGGSILLDVMSMSEFDRYSEGSGYSHQLTNGFWADEDYFVFENRFKYESEQVTLDKYTIITAQREFEIYNWLQYYDKLMLAEEFASNGLTITSWYANVAGNHLTKNPQQ
ncbi:MAG: class I SAM-dependent methyltransferase, partial [Chloroflexi bacterium]|nr:class I SAM-dependent methyltransferase [Chloroflexota bacterium]